MRGRIAHLAARMIAVDGVCDYGLAKRKAARQAGAPDSRNLPTNLEIEDALRAYQALYQADEHPEQLQHLRRLALQMMRVLEAFSPHLTGPVLSGSAGRHTEIHLHLYTDDVKELEVFLLNREIPLRTRETRVWSGDSSSVVPSFLISSRDADYCITVLGTRHQRQPLRMTSDGRPLERATIQSVESLVTAADQ
jgi:alpha-amylase/alpha-mannosidase (GH57 family)